MTDLYGEIAFYRSHCDDLGKRILQLQKDNTRILRDHKRTRVLAKLIAEAHRRTNSAVPMVDVGKRFLQILMGTLNVDRAVILKYNRDKGCFLVIDALGFGTDTPDVLRLPSLPNEFIYVNSKTVTDAWIQALRNYVKAPFLLWAFSSQHELALILGNLSEDNNLHAPFEKMDKEIVEGALNVFIDIFERKKAEETLYRRDSVLEAVGFAAERFMRLPRWEEYIDQILERLGHALTMCCATLYQNITNSDGLIRSQRHSRWENRDLYCQKSPLPKPIRTIPTTLLSLWEQKLRQGKIVKGNINDFPRKEKKILAGYGIRSMLAIPILCGDQWWGLLAFFDYFNGHDFSNIETEAVKLAAGTLGALIQRNRMDKILMESEEKYRLITENISDIVWTMDLQMKPTYVSPSVELILGYTVKEAIDRPLEKILSKQSYRKIAYMINHLRTMEKNELDNTKWPLTMEVEMIHKDGFPVICEASNLPIFDSDYHITGLIGVTRDVRERKRYEQELIESKDLAEKASRAKSDFLANMSHELRTPLNHIIGFTELIVDKNFGDLNDTQEEYLNDVLDSGRHLLSLINDILDLSKIESGKLELQLIEIDLKAMLKRSLVMIQEKALKNGIQLSLCLKYIPDTIQADERKLKQILYNLLSNAIKFTPRGGGIRLSARLTDTSNPERPSPESDLSFNPLPAQNQWIQISISDTGIGLKKEECEFIFNPFEQVERSTSRKYPGTGLGLSLTRRLVELHGGRVWAESDGPGQGSVFSFTLPVRARNEKKVVDGSSILLKP